MEKDSKLLILITSVKEKYLKCNDVKLKKHVGNIMTGDIRIKEGKDEEKSMSNV